MLLRQYSPQFVVWVVVLALMVQWTTAFSLLNSGSAMILRGRLLSMEYIPDGMSKAQWEAVKKKEKESVKGKDLGAVGITKFKSRSFEAWQKTGGKHLFPVGSDVPVEARPYMQRTGGSIDGEDLKKKGIKGVGQAAFSKKTEVDEKYEKLQKEGKLRSAAFSVPWTSEAAEKQARENALKNKAAATVGKKGAVPSDKVTPSKKEEEPPKKKGFFGLF